MAEETKKETKVEKKEVKKLDDVKNTEENKKAIAEAEGKVEEKKGSKSAVEKVKQATGLHDSSKQSKDSSTKDVKVEKKEVKSELAREYIVPLRFKVNKVPRYKRAKKAIKVLKEFIAKHMKVEDRDLNKVKVDKFLNNEIWFRGIKKPPAKIKVKAVKDSEGIVRVELVDIPEKVKFAMNWEKKRAEGVKASKTKAPVEEKKEETDEEKKEAKEKEKASVEAGLKAQKAAAKTEKHTATGKHAKTTAPVRKSLKK
tara:strand:- start:2891 stop:3658 length:768 start_codon:yes stop_codon:yes gene_type:complete